jgi:hypothetical protein
MTAISDNAEEITESLYQAAIPCNRRDPRFVVFDLAVPGSWFGFR